MITKQIRLSQQAKDHLARLKGKTGIQYWNVLSRWALCLSLAEPSRPVDQGIRPDSNVEMSWHVFGGEYHEVYAALVIERCRIDGVDLDPGSVAREFSLHLHRGVSYLAAAGFVRSISDLIGLVTKDTRSPDADDSVEMESERLATIS
ncbi:MAG: DNA sulfur modification protein DndE [Ignavibacteriales bacterium]